MAAVQLKEIKTIEYKSPAIEKGYTNQTLALDISDSSATIKPVDDKNETDFYRRQGI